MRQNPCQNPSWLLCRIWQADSKIHMKLQRTQNSQNNSEKEKSRRIHTSWFQSFLQSNAIKRGTGITTDLRTNGTELQVQRYPHTSTVNWVLPRVQKSFNRRKNSLSKKWWSDNWLPHEKERSWTLTPQQKQKLTQNVSKIQM